ncbi:hypothetical protein I3842_10G059800 [Carya illinoinensis]|uniref:Uncharacterized protein n=1 Tax=Carya illinoinensis TaxID=32201 RepID=A0A922DUY8_CARIL|nr:hypothetical protein I3842_10G059800 [Carya illinoinensis]
MAEFINYPQVSLEGDSQLVISSISKTEVNWQISTISEDIANSLKLHSGWYFNKIDRSQNRLAHSVAQWVATNFLFGSIPLEFIPPIILLLDSRKDPPHSL